MTDLLPIPMPMYIYISCVHAWYMMQVYLLPYIIHDETMIGWTDISPLSNPDHTHYIAGMTCQRIPEWHAWMHVFLFVCFPLIWRSSFPNFLTWQNACGPFLELCFRAVGGWLLTDERLGRLCHVVFPLFRSSLSKIAGSTIFWVYRLCDANAPSLAWIGSGRWSAQGLIYQLGFEVIQLKSSLI